MTIQEEEEGKSEDEPIDSVNDANWSSFCYASGLSNVSEIEDTEQINYCLPE